ncbi:MAG: NAD(P)/FAD-dependent oxidoreductase [Rhodoferax sp.]
MNQTNPQVDCLLTPYWWDDVHRVALADLTLPAKVDVAVVGAGYTGLHAALQTARGARSTIVFDAEEAGWGGSTRNGGQISTSIKPAFEQLARRHGASLALDIVREGQRSLAWIGEFVRSERIECDFAQVGHFHAAHNAKQYDALAAKIAAQPKGLEMDAHMVSRAEQRSELGTDAYFGGAVYPQYCSIHPARYHAGLLSTTLAAGALVAARCPVTSIEREGDSFRLRTPRGEVVARDVIIASNGYTGKLTPWLQRRVIPIGSYMIATEPLPEGTTARLIPNNRMVTDTRKVIYYYRCSPDNRRILFGGRVSCSETDPRISGPKLQAEMVHLFPELRQARISHSWCGFIAYTFDELMHVGKHDGMHYAMGYCGSGVGVSSYFGMRIGQQVLGLKEGRTALDGVAFQTRPLYTGNPWFLAPSVMYYRWRDRAPF